MLTYTDVEGYLSSALAPSYNPLPFFDPGPGSSLRVQDLDPDTMVIITVGNGPGLDMEEVFDRVSVQIRTIGPQQDYTGAEQLAQAVDKAMVALDHSQNLNGKRLLSVVRSGGSPSLLPQDDGDRYHFTCNYIWEVQY